MVNLPLPRSLYMDSMLTMRLTRRLSTVVSTMLLSGTLRQSNHRARVRPFSGSALAKKSPPEFELI